MVFKWEKYNLLVLSDECSNPSIAMDLGGYRLAIEVKDGDFEIHRGFNKKKPSMVLKLNTKNIKDLLIID